MRFSLHIPTRARTVLDAMLLALVPVVILYITCSDAFRPDPDTYYHAGIARLYAFDGWVGEFPWLERTVLREFPNVHLGLHLLLAPLARLAAPLDLLRLAPVLAGSLMLLQVFLVLRRNGVAWAGAWTLLGSLSAPVLLFYMASIKGGAGFFPLFIWFLDGLAHKSVKRVLLLSWLSVYVYTGAAILIAATLVFLLVQRIWEGRLEYRVLGAVVLGLALGLLINPFWPHHIEHLQGELAIALSPDAQSHLIPGLTLGIEWRALQARDVFTLAPFFVVAWGLVLVFSLARRERMPSQVAFFTLVALGLALASLRSGPKMLQLACVASLIGLPIVLASFPNVPRAWAALCVPALLVLGVRNVSAQTESNRNHPSHEDLAHVAQYLAGQTSPGEIVLAPWDLFPGLFYFNQHSHYLVGMNPDFLYRRTPSDFSGYEALYVRGEQPAQVLDDHFPGVRYLLVRAQPANAGERRLLHGLAASAAFEELWVPDRTRFRLFVRRESDSRDDRVLALVNAQVPSPAHP
jgi:hypothetical protein